MPRAATSTFDGEWINVGTKERLKDTLAVVAVKGCEIVLHRAGANENYDGHFSPDQPDSVAGTADRFPPGVVWTAWIEH